MGSTIDRITLDTNVLHCTAGDLLGNGIAAHERLCVATARGCALDDGCGGGDGEGEKGEDVGELHLEVVVKDVGLVRWFSCWEV